MRAKMVSLLVALGTVAAVAGSLKMVVGSPRSRQARSFRSPQNVHITLLRDFHRGVENQIRSLEVCCGQT